jgi:hypothetical protein
MLQSVRLLLSVVGYSHKHLVELPFRICYISERVRFLSLIRQQGRVRLHRSSLLCSNVFLIQMPIIKLCRTWHGQVRRLTRNSLEDKLKLAHVDVQVRRR